MNKRIGVALISAAGVVMAGSAQAAAVDLTAITGAFTAADIVTGVMAIAGTLAVVYVSIKGAKIVLGMLRGA